MMAGTPKVELCGVKKRFGPKIVLDGIDLKIEHGQSLVVIGGSGTGKSVMIKCVLGILWPDAGQIFVDGEEVTRLRALGATRVSTDVIEDEGFRWVVMADSEGNEFCVCVEPAGVNS